MLLVGVAILLIYSATPPDQSRIVRKVTIKAPPDDIFAHITDLRQFNEWNSFATADLISAFTYGATSAGLGGSYN